MVSKIVFGIIVLLAVVLITVGVLATSWPDSTTEDPFAQWKSEPTSGQKPCALRQYPAGFVCVCNATYCDNLDNKTVSLNDPDQIVLITSSERGLRYYRTEATWTDGKPAIVNDFEGNTIEFPLLKRLFSMTFNILRLESNQSTVTVRRGERQSIIGFGGAITGSVIYNFEGIPEELENHLLESYYSGSQGIGYTMLRMPIGGSDFDIIPWAYNEQPENDPTLSNFTQLDYHDVKIVKRIKKIKAMLGDQKLKIKVAAWGCPRWMRSRNTWSGPGVLKPEYYQTWADYHIRFLRLMKEQGIDIWAVSTGNEPINALMSWFFAPWIILGWFPKELAQYVAENLGPTVRASEFKDIVILTGDDQRITFSWFYEEMRRFNPKSMDYIDGFAAHSYMDQFAPIQVYDWNKRQFPDKFIIYTESSIGDVRYNPRGPDLGSWDRAMEYIQMYMGALQASISGWIDWNLALDERGGPNYARNYVDSPVVVNATGAEIYKQPIFYAIGHFSKFIPEGSVNIDVSSDWGEVESIGFRRPDGSIVVIVHNRYVESVEVTLNDEKRGSKQLILPPRSITSVVYQEPK